MEENEYLLKSVHVEFEKRVEEENTRQNHRITNLEATIQQIVGLATAVERLATNMEHMVKEQQEQGERLKALEGKDGDMWRTAISHLLVALVGGIATYFLTKMGL